MHFNVGLRFKLVVAFVINKIVPLQTLAGRVVLPLLLWWVIGYELQLVFGVLCAFGWLLKVKSIDVFWLLYASWWISFCVLAFPQTLAISIIYYLLFYALMCGTSLYLSLSAHVLWHFSSQAAIVLILLSGAKL